MSTHSFNLNDYEPTDEKINIIIELGNKHLKSTQQHSAINTLRKQQPDWLIGSILQDHHIMLSNMIQHPIELEHRKVKQLVMMPHKTLITDIYTMNIDPKQSSYQKMVETLPRNAKKPKAAVPKPNKNMLQAFTRLRHKQFKQKKLLKKRLTYYNKRKRTGDKQKEDKQAQ